MHTERLRQIADLIERKRFLFDQTTIGHMNADPRGDDCNLGGSVADWAYWVYGNGKAKCETSRSAAVERILTVARETLDLTERQAGRLLGRYWPNWWIRVMDLGEKWRMEQGVFTPSADQAARALRKLAEIDDVPEDEHDYPVTDAVNDGRPTT